MIDRLLVTIIIEGSLEINGRNYSKQTTICLVADILAFLYWEFYAKL